MHMMSRIQPTRLPNGCFVSPFNELSGFFNVMRGFMRAKDLSSIPDSAEELDRTLPVHKPQWLDATHKGVRTTWIGHATVYTEIEGVAIITDPIFSQRCSPVQWIGRARYRPVPCTIEEIPRLDICVISHDHYDHLDHNSVVRLARRFPKLSWFVPLGMRAWLHSVGVTENVRELGWWEEAKYNDSVRIVAFPSNHWCKRSALGTNERLWCSWGVFTPNYKFFFAGDTAACDVFSEIGRDYGPFDLAAIPIGAYEPRDVMKNQHINPEEAVFMHQQLRAKYSLGIHWGTFKLTFEHYLEPPQLMRKFATAAGLSEDAFFTLPHGQSRVILQEGAAAP